MKNLLTAYQKINPKIEIVSIWDLKNIQVINDFEHIGYKIAVASIDGQKYINVSGPILGVLFKHNIYSNIDTINFTNYAIGVAEAEIAFKLSKKYFFILKRNKRN